MGAVTHLKCPHCNRKSSTTRELKEGAKLRCPACRQVFSYAPEVEAIALAEIEALPSAKKGAISPEVVRPESASPPHRAQPPPVAVVQQIHVNVPEARKGNSLAVAALVLGIVAALICWVPFLGLLSIPAALLGTLLGLIGLLLAVLGRRSGLASSLVGTAISLGAIVLAIAITGSTSRSISNALEQQKKDEGAVAKAFVQPANPGAKVQPINANKFALTRQPAPAQGKPTLPDDSPEEWVTAPTPAKLGDVVVKIASAKIDRVPLKGATGEGQSAQPLLILSLEITNTNPNRKIEYRGWAGEDFSFERDYATPKDNNGNSYKRISFGIFDRPIGATQSDSIYPDKLLQDVLVFEVPLKTADSLDLELPGKNVGEKGFFRIRVPSSMVQR